VHIAIDTGGTFTDCVYLQDGTLRVLKVLSTPEDPGNAVVEAVQTLAAGKVSWVSHGTTVGTNVLLERKGARVAFVTTAGFEDTISIGRQAREHLYDWFATPQPCIVPAELRFGIAERTASDGTILQSPTAEEMSELAGKIKASGAQSIAISFLFSFANPTNEIAVAGVLRELGLPVSVSHVILPEFREYERASTVSVNAYLVPKAGTYLQRLDDSLRQVAHCSRFEVMQSSGGIIHAGFAAEQPVRTVLSGPAGGVMGAYWIARQSGFPKIIAFDMGGTSTDVCLVDEGEGGPKATIEAVISRMPVCVPMLDIHTIGAGGGSLARFDDAGVLHVGPESAGAQPGPVCYGRGTRPTVSDGNLILGRLHPEHFLGGKVRLDYDRTRHHMEEARGSMATAEEFASGIVLLAEAAMERAIRVISVERGYDPREFTLVAFGGAGPLHACALAKTLQMPRVLVPTSPGALSALGILLADTVRDYSKTVMLAADADFEAHFRELEERAQSGLQGIGVSASFVRSLDLRYVGQGYELNVPAGPDFVSSFRHAHKKRYGYADDRKTVEVVNVRLRVTVPGEVIDLPASPSRNGQGRQAMIEERPVIFEGRSQPAKVYQRDQLEAGDRLDGPAIVVEYSATTVVPPGCTTVVDRYKNLVIEVVQ
jgi:N-methylhydantoinase A